MIKALDKKKTVAETTTYTVTLRIPRNRYADVRKKLDNLLRRAGLSCEVQPEVTQ